MGSPRCERGNISPHSFITNKRERERGREGGREGERERERERGREGERERGREGERERERERDCKDRKGCRIGLDLAPDERCLKMC